jgi:peptidoglycan/xylan/chitin deacetylase (PgdA/CDA1 family)
MEKSKKRFILGGIVVGALAIGTLSMTGALTHKELTKSDPTYQQKLVLLHDFVETQELNEISMSSAKPSKLQGLDREFFDLYNMNYVDVVNYIVDRAQKQSIKDPEKMLGFYLEQMSRVYFQADLEIQEFDKTLQEELAKPANERVNSMMALPIYQEQLIPLWIMKEKIGKQIIYVILNMLMMENAEGFDVPTEKIQAANQVLNHTREIWAQIAEDNAANPTHKRNNRVIRYALQDLFRDTAYAVAKYIEDHYNAFNIYPPATVSSFLSLTRDLAFQKESEQKEWEEKIRSDLAAEVQNEATRLSSEAATQSSWITLVRRSLAISLQASAHAFPKDPQQARTTQNAAAKFCPDANNARGNIVGNEFPKGTWAITLDDGPNAAHSGTILNAFKASPGSKGSFFWLSQLTTSSKNTNVIDAIKADGHTLANHSFSHANLPKLSQVQLNKEIIESTANHSAVYGFRPKFFRCPYGACGSSGGNIRKMLEQQSLVHVFWNIDTLDWKDKNADLLFNRTKQQIEMIDSKGRGGVILFHDIHETSAGALQKLIPWMVSRGYKLRNLADIVGEMNTAPCSNGWTPASTQ